MRIVELECNFFMELSDVIMLSHILRHCLLYRSGDEEILLFQTKLFPCIVVIIRIEYLHDIAGKVLLFHRLLVIALVEGIQLEAFHRLRIPDAQRVDNTVSVAHDRDIIGNRLDRLIALLSEMASAVLVHIDIDIAAKFYFLRILRPFQFKRIAVLQPVIRHFHLKTIPDLLFEHAVMIADATAVGFIPQGGQGIQKTCRQTA